jgi:hypothetical protein
VRIRPELAMGGCGSQDGRLMPMLVTICYSLKITLKRPLLTVNAPLPV